MNSSLFAISGATGQTGSAVASTLLQHGHSVRVLVRNAAKAAAWAARGAEVMEADFADSDSLARGLNGAVGAYFLNPPDYHSSDMFASAQRMGEVWCRAMERSEVESLVALSSVGAHLASGTGNIYTTHLLEQTLGSLRADVHFVRAAWFMENWAGALAVAAKDGVLPSFLAPLDRAIAMVSASDIGRVCAETLMAGANAPRITELHGPKEYSPNDVAAAVSAVLKRDVSPVIVPESDWGATLGKWGFSAHAIETWGEMVRGFNSGHIVFEGGTCTPAFGTMDFVDAAKVMNSKGK